MKRKSGLSESFRKGRGETVWSTLKDRHIQDHFSLSVYHPIRKVADIFCHKSPVMQALTLAIAATLTLLCAARRSDSKFGL